MDEKVVDGNISFIALTDDDGKVYGYEIFMAVENSSGITVNGDTKEECIENLKSYLLDGLTEAENR